MNKLITYQSIEQGKSYPLGSTVTPQGVNFSVYSKNSTKMELSLWDDKEDREPVKVIKLDPKVNRTADYWHVFIPGLKAGQMYAYRAYGPHKPEKGQRFDGQKLLLDPYGKAIAIPSIYSRDAASSPGETSRTAMKSVVVEVSSYDWKGDEPLRRSFSQTVIYELHVKGFTRHPSSGLDEEIRGTYSGLVEKIPYLKDLGVTAVELLPVFQYDEQEAPPGLVNYWGYNPISFFAPHCGYSSCKDPTSPIDEFKDMVKSLHRAGIEVILDVVYNHTAESDHNGPTYCYRGLENSTYYILNEKNASLYANYSGTGNTLNANNSMVRRLILDSLHYWVEEMHVDGFRFDLASILSRDEHGTPLANPPILWDIENDPILAGTKLIAEAWDAAGLYQVGTFVGDRWKEWNGQFRDDVRAFMIGKVSTASKVASRFFASPDIYGHEEREPEQSINFVTCHDGFTLNDLVSYNRKHNLANGEGDRDGSDLNFSYNFGIEGPTEDHEIEKQRNRQVKNFLTITLSALGVPMLLMGDEMRRTQGGNNNAYCQDNEVSWLNWSLLNKHKDIHRFVKLLIQLRLSLDVFKYDNDLSLSQLLRLARVQWHGVKLDNPDWSDQSHSLSFTVRGRRELFHLIINAYWEALEFELPPVQNGNGWHRIVDTYLESPEDINEPSIAPCVSESVYVVQPRTVVILAAERDAL